MPTPTYSPLATVTLGASASSVTFSSIPATYRDLILVMDNIKNATTDQQLEIRLNGDSGGNYFYVNAIGSSTGAESSAFSSQPAARAGNVNTTAGNHILQFMDYSATDKHKTVLARSDDVGRSQTWMFANRWANTSAVTTILVKPIANPFSTGARFDLYGIEA